MPTVLITGANRGIGLEFARQYAEAGYRVHAACRTPGSADALGSLGKGVKLHALDVTDHGRIEALAAGLEGEAIDIVINNAGIYGDQQELGKIDYAAWEEVMRVNTLAPLKMAECFLPHLEAGKMKMIASLTSRMGSIAENDAGGVYIYRSSKAALNAAARSLALDLAPRGITVIVFHPGWVKTDMGGAGALIDAETSVGGMRAVIKGAGPKDSGRFFNYDGTEVPW
ncbi:MAG: SDR family oxidoreductase [Proteobacteria bacterium]|nr:SDR family oxidoreductase [Pseudomonadota bacterium]MCZ6482015.1 SDR family oxidoreductase [Alphaproteobacteria bacterium]MCZ6745427.1 SDR family oxidoreductase [Alphaproteobacteria bacterium]TDI58295.1 MAG: SDR family oxidoreductase [Alphaproteobacteria bacterium]